MSTGADCGFWETERGWFYKLQKWPYGDTREYDEFGPFPTFGVANDHLSNNHANPGGYWVDPLPGCEHPPEHRRTRYVPGEWDCRKCGHTHCPK